MKYDIGFENTILISNKQLVRILVLMIVRNFCLDLVLHYNKIYLAVIFAVAETDIALIKSKANSHEAHFITSLCLYLLQQGYQRSQITILTGYTGQLMTFKRMMPRSQFEGNNLSR